MGTISDAIGRSAMDIRYVRTVNGDTPDASGDVEVAAASAVDATTTTKGVVKLAGDLGGTAGSPTVPGLTGKVPTTRTVAGHALSGDVTITAADVSAVPTTRTVAGHALSADVTITASDVSAVPTTRTVNGHALSADVTVTASDVSAVPTTRTVNGHALSADVTVTAADVSAAPTSRQVIAGTGLTGGGDLSADRTLTVAYGSTSTTACVGNDSRLSNARTPTAHAASHANGGSDQVSVDASQVTTGTLAAARIPALSSNAGAAGVDVAVSAATLTTALTTGSLAIGTWLVQAGLTMMAGGTVAQIDALSSVGTATATLAGQTAATVRPSSASNSGYIALTFIATVTVAGTLLISVQCAQSCTVKAATSVTSAAGASGWTAVKIG